MAGAEFAIELMGNFGRVDMVLLWLGVEAVSYTHLDVYKRQLQGFERTDVPAFSFQGHPEASPGPRDVAHLFDRFIKLMQDQKAGGK